MDDSPTLPGRRPDVAVIVPCYNYGRFLRGCVQSVLTTTRLDVRVIVVDDASSDQTAAVCAALMSEDPRVSVLRHETNRGHIATYNHGLDLANAEYVHLISADDELTPFALDRAVAIMRCHPDVGMVYGRVARMSTPRRPAILAPQSAVYSIVRGPDWVEARCRDGRNPILSPEVTLRRSVAAQTGSYDSRLPDLADLEMWLRTAARSNIAIIENAHQAVYRVHGQNMNLASSRTHGPMGGIRQRLAAFESFFEKDGHLLAHVEQLRTIARLRAAHDAVSRARSEFDDTSAARESLSQAMDFAISVHAEAQGMREWRYARQTLKRRRSGYPIHLRRLITRARRSWHWRMNNRDLGRHGIPTIYRGRVWAPSSDLTSQIARGKLTRWYRTAGRALRIQRLGSQLGLVSKPRTTDVS